MLGKTLAAAVVAAFFVVAPAAAYAAPVSAAAVHVTSDDDSYTPTQHSVMSLDGSAVLSQCVKDVPWIHFSVVLTDTANKSTSHDAVLIMTGSGGQTTTIPLGKLDKDNKLSGKVLWPGASVDAHGNATGWPGWAFQNGQWVETDGNFAWTRGHITAVIKVNPELTVPLAYPPATALCASPPPTDPHGLAVTGSDFDPAPLLWAAGGLIVLGGLTVVFVSRRAASRR